MRALIALVLLGALCTFATANYQYTSRRYGNRYGNTNYRNSNYGSSYRYGQRTSNSNNRNSYGYRCKYYNYIASIIFDYCNDFLLCL